MPCSVLSERRSAHLRSCDDCRCQADVPQEAQRSREGIISARTYDYAGEAECDANAQICLRCIEVLRFSSVAQAVLTVCSTLC